MKARKRAKGPRARRRETSFNGAAPLKARKLLARVASLGRLTGFNGAAPLKARKHTRKSSVSASLLSLQWGRAVEGAETRQHPVSAKGGV